MKIIIEENIIANIPVLSISPKKEQLMPVVIFIHGYGGDREQALDFGYMFAKLGFFFISFDCLDHGIRSRKHAEQETRRFKALYPQDTGIDTYIHMHEVIERTKEDINTLINYFIDNKQIDKGRIGLTGFSMGGFATFYNAANSNKIKVAVPIAGKPAFKKAWEDLILSTSTYAQWSEQIKHLQNETVERTSYLEEIDPFENMIRFAPKPLLIINGDMDTDQPYLYSLELYKRLIPYYEKDPEKLKLSIPFVDHRLTYDIKKQVCDWFERYL